MLKIFNTFSQVWLRTSRSVLELTGSKPSSSLDFLVAGFVRIQKGSDVPIQNGLVRSLTTSATGEFLNSNFVTADQNLP